MAGKLPLEEFTFKRLKTRCISFLILKILKARCVKFFHLGKIETRWGGGYIYCSWLGFEFQPSVWNHITGRY